MSDNQTGNTTEGAADAPEMVRVQIARAFTLNRDNGTVAAFAPTGTNCGEPGYYDVTRDDAEHWFLQANTTTPPPPIPPLPGTPAAVEIERKKLTRRRLVEGAREQEARDTADQVRREKQAKLRDALGSDSGETML
jgi:hypothetical protein